MRRSIHALGLVASLAIVMPPAGAFAQPSSPAPTDVDAAFTQHMNNGVNLYKLKHYQPALVEFEAAYKLKPKASPLVNEALCYRELFKYPQAVAALEKALGEHADTLDAANKQAAEQAIAEMKPLFAFVALKITPPDATVTMDGDDVPAANWTELAVAPIEHAFVISRDGFATETRSITVASGDHQAIDVTLVSKTGTLHVIAQKETRIAIDGSLVGTGEWTGPLDAGDHTVKFDDGDAQHIKIDGGASATLDVSHPAPVPTPPAALPAPPPKTPIVTPKKDAGFFMLVQGGILYPTRLPEAFQREATPTALDAANNFGAMGGLRAGYRVNTYAAFEGLFEYANVTGGRERAVGVNDQPGEYSFSSWRFGPILRLMSPGKIARFVGTVGGGFALHTIKFTNVTGDAGCATGSSTSPGPTQCANGWGVDFFVTTDAGVEFSIDHVILGASLVLTVDGTKGTEDFGDHPSDVSNPYANDALAFIGPVAHFGYAFW